MKKLFTFSVIIFTFFQLKAQRDLKPGYIITNSNDTVFGQVDYQGDVYNAGTCYFLGNNATQPVKYLPGDINAYRITDGKFYVSRKIQIEKVEKVVFLEFLVSGKADIYYYPDKYYFIEKEDKGLHILENTEALVDRNGQQYLKEYKEYIGVLNSYMQDCPDVWNKISKTKLNQSNLIQLATEYHSKICPGEECIVYSKNSPKTIFRLGYSLGCNYNYLQLIMDPPGYKGSKWEPGIMTGLELNMQTKGISERFSLTAGFYYSIVNQSVIVHQFDYTAIKADYKSKNYLIDAIVFYTYPKYKIKPLIGVGILYFQTTSQSVSDTKGYNPVKFSIGPLLAGGAIMDLSNRFSLKFETNFQYGVYNVWKDNNLMSKVNNLNFLLSIQYALNK